MAHLIGSYIPQILSTVLLLSLFVRVDSVQKNKTDVKLNIQNVSPVVDITEKVIDKPKVINTTEFSNSTHKGREHVSEKNESKLNVSSDSNSKNTNVNQTISNSSIASSVLPQSTTKKPMKPLLTEHDEIVVHSLKSDQDVPTLAHIDTSMDKKVRRADYIVPIVAVILSVPLVAVLISALYKKGKDWWQHRNYRRMDYLIEGMYNS